MFEAIAAVVRELFMFVGLVAPKSCFPPPLSESEERELVGKLKNGDQDARDRLIEHNLRLVAHIAKKYAQDKDSLDDLISVGTIGLIKGINTFDAQKTSKLTTYIARCIENAILTQGEQK